MNAQLHDPIYLDCNSTTPVLLEVVEAMRPFWHETFGNPASAHTVGRRARRALETAREQVAALVQAEPDEVIFTSGATEANNLAIFGLAHAERGSALSSAIEHPSVTEPLAQLAKRGWGIQHLPIKRDGILASTLPEAAAACDLVALMLANHETGAIQPVMALAATLGERRPYFHCDATQAVGKMPVRFHDLGVSTLSFSAHKFHGPRGIGGLLVRRGVPLQPQLWGGHQQAGKRPGTEPVALAVGLARALALATEQMPSRTATVWERRQTLLERLAVVEAVLNGPIENCLPHVLNLSFPGCQADAVLMKLDLMGVCCSAGSACSSGSLLPSPTLQAMGCPSEILQSAIRFSWSHLTSDADMALAADRIVQCIRALRPMFAAS